MNCITENMVTNTFTDMLLTWIKEHRLTIDDTRLVKAKAINFLDTIYPAFAGDFKLDIQYYSGGEYSVIPRNLLTGLAICEELPPKELCPSGAAGVYQGRKGTYEFNDKNFIFRPYLKPKTVYVDMTVRV